MTNHVHLLATAGTAEAVPETMQTVGRRYVGGSTGSIAEGTLWEGRYRATLVEVDRDFFSCMRYIELSYCGTHGGSPRG